MIAYFDKDPRTLAAAMIGGAFSQLPDVAIDCDDDVLAFRLSAARMVLETKAKTMGML